MSRTLDTLRLSAEEARALLDRREVSPDELWDAYRAAIDGSNEELNAFLTLDEVFANAPDRDGDHFRSPPA
jgi:Asp-tRNA(Asn)/Glu-tRNA(Gln) amidotransferase A subunit family amidase